MDESLLEEIPFISAAVSLYRIGLTIRERNHLKKLLIFIQEINKEIVDKDKLRKYKLKLNENKEFRNEELEYIIILIDRYIGYEKPAMLAKLYLTYLDGKIMWKVFLVYSEIIDRLLSPDLNTLNNNTTIEIYDNNGGESALRLVSLGLMTETTNNSGYDVVDGKYYVINSHVLERATSRNRTYSRTKFGERLAGILNS